MNAKNIGWVIGDAVVASVVAYLLIWGYAGGFSGSSADHLRNLIFFAGGITAAIITAWRAWVADKQTQINEQSQITERFTKAVEQLGSDNIYIRIGALHALERIGRDSENDVVAILRLLASFVRSQSPAQDNDDASTPLDAVEGFAVTSRLAKLLKNTERRIVKFDSSHLTRLSNPNGCFFQFGFYRCNLSHGFFPGSDFAGANFSYACLKEAKLQRCNFRDAPFTRATLDGADFRGAVCNRTNFSTAKNLTTKMLKDIIYDAETPPKVPKGVTLPPPRKKQSGAGQ